MTLKPILAAVLTTTLLIGGCSSNAKAQSSSQVSPNLGVNTYLWRASMETLNFMPLDQVDPFGGVIITDWYANPQVPAERFKANVYILDTNLRADGLKVSIFKQTGNFVTRQKMVAQMIESGRVMVTQSIPFNMADINIMRTTSLSGGLDVPMFGKNKNIDKIVYKSDAPKCTAVALNKPHHADICQRLNIAESLTLRSRIQASQAASGVPNVAFLCLGQLYSFKRHLYLLEIL